MVALRDAGARRLLTPEELANKDRRPDRNSVGAVALAPNARASAMLGQTA